MLGSKRTAGTKTVFPIDICCKGANGVGMMQTPSTEEYDEMFQER